MTLDWRGDQVRNKVREAERFGINETLSACVINAKGLVRVKSATLQGSIRAEMAADDGGGMRGEWGSYGVDYALPQETGPVNVSYTWGYTPFLRPTADQEYPRLRERIQRAM